MGSLSTRWYIKELGGGAPVDDWASLAGPNHGTVNYGTWWLPCDEVINPASSVPLEGAANHETACLHHLDLLSDKAVYEQVREFVK
jgi:triacylglycerol lipase